MPASTQQNQMSDAEYLAAVLLEDIVLECEDDEHEEKSRDRLARLKARRDPDDVEK